MTRRFQWVVLSALALSACFWWWIVAEVLGLLEWACIKVAGARKRMEARVEHLIEERERV